MAVPQPIQESGEAHAVKRAAIHDAAIAQFSARGIARTSMANIAAAAGMSRPALYQYFDNKNDIFASAFIALFDEHVERALAALDEPGSTAERLNGFLQRFDGDLWQRLAASAHADEIATVKTEEVAAGVADVTARLRDGLADHLAHTVKGRTPRVGADRQAGWLAVLRFSPAGLKSDQPSIDEFRNRLSALAHSVASDIDAG